MTPAALRACAEDINQIQIAINSCAAPGLSVKIEALDRLRDRLAAETPAGSFQEGIEAAASVLMDSAASALQHAPTEKTAYVLQANAQTILGLAATRPEAPAENVLVADFIDWLCDKGLVIAKRDDAGDWVPINEQDGERIASDYLAANTSTKAMP